MIKSSDLGFLINDYWKYFGSGDIKNNIKLINQYHLDVLNIKFQMFNEYFVRNYIIQKDVSKNISIDKGFLFLSICQHFNLKK